MPLGYIWARERVTGEHPHYHLVLLFDREAYAYLGDYTKPDADNMGTRIQKAGAAPLGLIILNMLISRIFRRITARGSLGMMR